MDGGGCVPGRRGYCRARHGRSGYAECNDCWNDDGSPDAHGSSKAIPEVSGMVTPTTPTYVAI
jgi:hypothetical protein